MKIQTIQRSALLAIALATGATASAQLAPKTIYGMFNGSYIMEEKPATTAGFAHCLTNDTENITVDYPISFSTIGAGAEAHGMYYYFEYSQEAVGGYKSIGFYELDTETGDLRNIADYGYQKTTTMSCMCYDYSTETLYCINGLMGGTILSKVNIEDGTLQDVGTLGGLFEHPDYPDFGDKIKALGCNYDGEMYAITYWGRLYKVNKFTADMDLIAQLDYNPEVAFMYPNNNLMFDNETDECYWWFYTYPNRYEMRKLDIKTGHSERIYDQSIWGFTGAYIPFLAAEASAPAKAQNVTVTPAGEGQLQATLSWDNPSKTFGRGGTLEELDSIVVFRENVRQVAFTDVQIGGHMEWVDNNIDHQDYYTYKIIGYNSMGRGDRISASAYIGHGTPKPVAQITLEADENYNAHLSWTPVSMGLYDAWIDQESLVYDLVRQPDGVRIEGITGTSYTDVLPSIERYSYNIYARNADAISTATTSNRLICGPAFQPPYTFEFTSLTEFEQWMPYDNNGDGAYWRWSWGMGRYYVNGAYVYMNPNNPMAGWDWLISPAIELEGGKHYKVEFYARSLDSSQPECLSVSIGTDQTWQTQDSITTWTFANKDSIPMRFNLPVQTETCRRHIGFLARSVYSNWCFSIGHVSVSEDHDGTLEGRVTNPDGDPLYHAIVYSSDSIYNIYTEEDGSFRFDYLPKGQYDIITTAIGYVNDTTTITVEEYQTTTLNVTLQRVPAYTLTGQIVDKLGDPVIGAELQVTGYNEYFATTDSEGRFSIPGVFEFTDYTIRATKNRMVEWTQTFDVESDIDFGKIVMADNLRAPRSVSVEATDEQVAISWQSPCNDPQYFRYDDGTVVNSLGTSSGTKNSTFGVIFRTPMTLQGIKFYIAPSTATHTAVYVYAFDLDEQGNPTTNILYMNDYVPCVVGDWTTFNFKTEVECPRGVYLAVADASFLSLAVDGAGDKEQFPFMEGVNCYTGDYTQGFYYLDNTDYRQNFLVRAYGAPYEANDDAVQFVRPRSDAQHGVDASTEKPKLSCCLLNNAPYEADKESADQPLRTPISARTYYNVYRYAEGQVDDFSQWHTVADRISELSCTDPEWNSLPQGVYHYAVCAAYTGTEISDYVHSDLVGRLMYTTVTIKGNTNTPENEIEDAEILLVDTAREHGYQATFDWKGTISIPNVWKGQYTLKLSKKGFETQEVALDLSSESAYSFEYTLIENLEQPEKLIILHEGADDERELVWNFPDQLYDDFEEHEDFMIASPGELGWQYVDGDQSEVGGFSGIEYPHAFEPLSFMVFNNSATVPANNVSYMNPHSGNKCLASFAAVNGPNDDWFISPRLYYNEDFKFAFYAKSMQGAALREVIQVGYTTATQPDTAQFVWVKAEQKVSNSWTRYNYNIPAGATYVCVHHISANLYVLLIDDVAIGLKEGFPSKANDRNQAPHRSPSLDGQYEIYLDGELVGQTDDTHFLFKRLTTGTHTAGVLGSYTSGKTALSTIEFFVENGAGIENVKSDANSQGNRLYDLQGRHLQQATKGQTVISVGQKTMIINK